MAKFLNTVHSEDLGYCKEGRLVRALLEPLIWFHDDIRAELPVGFQSDCASVPRVPIIYDAFGDKVHREAFGHDFGYCKDAVFYKVDPRVNDMCGLIPEEYILDKFTMSKEDVDWIVFRQTMKDRMCMKDGVLVHMWDWETYQLMYLAVRGFGTSSFHKRNVMDSIPIETDI